VTNCRHLFHKSIAIYENNGISTQTIICDKYTDEIKEENKWNFIPWKKASYHEEISLILLLTSRTAFFVAGEF
jgi:hypothetical protein